MKYQKLELSNYNLHVIKTNRYKKINIKVIFRNKLNKKNLLHHKIISDVLLESNSIYSTKRLLAIKTESLYNLDAYNGINESGNVLVTSFNMSFLNDKYTEEGLFKDIIRFLSDVLFRPKVVDGKLDQKAIDLSKERIKDEIKSVKESPMSYTMENVYKTIGKGTNLALSVCDLEKDIDKVDAHELYLSYLKMLKESNVDIFIIGDVNSKEVEDIFESEFKLSDRKNKELDHIISFNKFKNKYTTKKDKLDNNQSILLLGYKLDGLTKYEMDYVLPVYSYILGGGPDSRLFQNVREKNSLCYSISSNIKGLFNFMYISAGINACNYKKALKLIKEEVAKMNNGEFDDNDIKKAKLTFTSAFKETYDSIYSMINVYVRHEFMGVDLLEDKVKNIKKVTKEDIMKVIPKIHPEIIYFLEGTKDNEKDSTC